MKSLLKYVKGGLKLSLLALPFALTAAGIAGAVITGVSTDKKINDLYDDFRNNEIIQEYIDHEQEVLDKKYENGDISSPEYLQQKDYIRSDDFIYKLINNNEEMKDFANLDKKTRSNIFYIIPAGVVVILGLFSTLKMFDERYKTIIGSAKEDFQEAKEIKKLKKTENELKEYSEEIL